MENASHSAGRLTARPGAVHSDNERGLLPLGLDGSRDGWLYVPATYNPDSPAPLVLMLHGAGGGGQGNLWPLRDMAEAAGMILLGPDSRRDTWDVIYGGYGPDVAFIDEVGRAHGEVFRDIRPASTALQISALINPELLVEIEVTAILQ